MHTHTHTHAPHRLHPSLITTVTFPGLLWAAAFHCGVPSAASEELICLECEGGMSVWGNVRMWVCLSARGEHGEEENWALKQAKSRARWNRLHQEKKKNNTTITTTQGLGKMTSKADWHKNKKNWNKTHFSFCSTYFRQQMTKQHWKS